MPFTSEVVEWLASKFGVQITVYGRKVGLVDDKFIPLWTEIRAGGLTRYTIGRASAISALFALIWIPLSWSRTHGVAWSLVEVLVCFVGVCLLAPVRWSQHEDRFLRLTTPWVIKRFD
jgi:hypothetical protein